MGHLTWEECLARWPRLIRAMMHAAILSETEAACAVRQWRDRDLYGGQVICGEAVTHFGGALAVMRQAIQWRHTYKAWDAA